MRQIIWATAILFAGFEPLPALADARDDVISGMTRCATLTDDRQWLDCYYGAAQPMRSKLGLPPAPQSQLKLLLVQPAPQTPIPSNVTHAAVRGGVPPPPKTASFLNIWGGDDIVNNALVSSYQVTKNGFTITLTDGQVWGQTVEDAGSHPVFWRMPASSMRVTITQAAMHTFNLVLDDENVHYKVYRIR